MAGGRGVKKDIDPAVAAARGRLGIALKKLDEDAAVEAVREMVQAKREDRLRRAQAIIEAETQRQVATS